MFRALCETWDSTAPYFLGLEGSRELIVRESASGAAPRFWVANPFARTNTIPVPFIRTLLKVISFFSPFRPQRRSSAKNGLY
jgi:hypothetical protein